MFTNITRAGKFALNNFSRNKGISIAAIFILVVAIMVATGLVFFQGISGYLTEEVRDKIDITAYFQEWAGEEDILAARDEIKKILEKLYALRKQKSLPYKDDKILTGWNGLMISAFAKGYQITRDKKKDCGKE